MHKQIARHGGWSRFSKWWATFVGRLRIKPADQSAFTYDAFLSYSQAADSRFAPFLQGAVQRFARPWYRLRTVRIFRDATGLTLTPGLWPDIERALNASRTFILLASPGAAQSKWVQQEINHWIGLKRGPPLLVLTEGTIVWDRSTNDFDWSRSISLPRLPRALFQSEPRYLDATELKVTDLSPRHPKIRSAAAEIYARLTGRPLDEVIGEDVRQYRRNRWTAVIALTVILASAAAFVMQLLEANRQTAIADARQQLQIARSAALLSLESNGGPTALDTTARDAARAAMLSVESMNLVPTPDAADALHAHLELAPNQRSSQSFARGAVFAALSPDGRSVATINPHGQVEITTANGSTRTEEVAAKLNSSKIALDNDGVAYRIDRGRVLLLSDQTPVSAQEDEIVLLSPKGTGYATIRKLPNDDREVALWQIGSSQPLHRWTARAMSVPAVFSNDGSYFAFVNGSGVSVVDVVTGARRESSPSDLNAITAIAVDNSGDAVLVLGWKPDLAQIVRLRHQVQTLPTTGQSTFRRVYLTPEGNVVRKLAIDKKAGLVAIEGGPPHWIWVGDYFSGDIISLLRSDDLRDWTLTQSAGDPAIVTASPSGVSTWSISRNSSVAARAPILRAADIGPSAALGAYSDFFVLSAMHKDEPREWFLSAVYMSGKQASERKIDKATQSMLPSPMGRFVVVTYLEGHSEVLSLPSLESVWRLPTEPAQKEDLLFAFSPDDRRLAWGSSQAGVRILELPAGRVEQIVAPPSTALSALAIAPNGSALAWAENGKEPGCNCVNIYLWARDRATRMLGTIQARGELSKPHLAFDREGERLVAGLGEATLRIWNVSGREAPKSYLQESSLKGLTFSFNGEYLITQGTARTNRSQESNEVAVWKFSEGRKVWRYLTPRRVAGAAMSRDGQFIVIAEHDALRSTGYLAIRLETLFWRAPDLLRIACNRFRYRLSDEERAIFLLGAGKESACPR